VSAAPSGAVLATTKLQSPRRPGGLVHRARLVRTLCASSEASLALLHAPVGSGKTTLLADWQAAPAEPRPFAWLSLDVADNDPVRFLEGIIAALRTVVPGAGERALAHLGGPAPLADVVLPSLVNDLAAQPERLVLVLDDFHVIADDRVHEVVAFLLERRPPTLELAIAGRAEPPVPLARLRLAGELVEIAAADLRFTEDEADALLREALGRALDPVDLARLQERTEGWAAGLRLAALSLSGRADQHAYIASFAGDDRPVVDLLGAEVLAAQAPDVRAFLVETAILERLSGPLCERVTGRPDAGVLLDGLERAGLLLVPLDGKRRWYRYHHLFAGLLRDELARTRTPADVAALHRRAAAWHRDDGSVDAAIAHATAGGDVAMATELITAHWYAYLQRGRIHTVAGWLDALGDGVVRAEAALCLTKAWIEVNTGRMPAVADWVGAAERTCSSAPVVESGIAGLREIHRYMDGDVAGSVRAGEQSVARGPTPWRPVGCPVLGLALFWEGRPEEAAAELEAAVGDARAVDNHLAVIHATSGLATIKAETGDIEAAAATAERALALADETGLAEHWATALSRVSRGRALAHAGRVGEATTAIERAAAVAEGGVAALEIAYARLACADVRALGGDPSGAGEAIAQARRIVDRCADAGILTERLARAQRRLDRGSARRDAPASAPAAVLTERELAVLRLLPTELSQREIGATLFVSLNTVKSHTRSIYRKLDADTRDDAVARARAIGLL
jgi:LuxR family maltose regulon positive regulatory protein